MTLIAVTGGSGFLGGHVLRVAAERGIHVRALCRKPQFPRAKVEWLQGALDRPETLLDLVEGADAVIHVAGVVNAPTLAGFTEGNVAGTATMLTAAEAQGVRRFIQVSSLSAREPDLSDYGWSKAAAEALVRTSPLDWTVVRPPAIYGPGDTEMLELFRCAAKGFIPLPPPGRLSIIEAGDLARLLIDLVDAPGTIETVIEPDDGHPLGWSHREFATLLGEAVGRKPRSFSVPGFILKSAARIEQYRKGAAAKLTLDRARYFCHPDWVCNPALRPPADLWQPRVDAAAGLKATADWYRQQRWL